VRISRNTRTIESSTTRFSRAIRYKNPPETRVPMIPVVLCRPEPSFLTCWSRVRMPKFSSSAGMNTMVEWPSEKKNPTDSGRLPSWTSLRVVLSMAAMWSAGPRDQP
jgi:hypothetical protein